MPPPRYTALVDRWTREIRDGRLAAGTRLPTHRDLARREGIALSTATRVYAELEAAGLVSREQGRGTFVRDLALPPGHGTDQEPLGPGVLDLAFNYPVLPGQPELLRRTLREVAGSGDLDALLRYHPHAGRPHERRLVAEHLRRRGVPTTPDRVLLVDGAQHGLALTAMAALSPGDVVAVDAVTYPGMKVLAETLRLRLAPVPVTAAGTDLDALERLCAERRVRAAYVVPTVHNPLGAVMDLPARRRLVALARRHDLLLVEDTAYAYLEVDPPPTLAALAPEHTVHVTGLSKSVATGLRVGFVSAPADLLPALERAVRATTWNTPALTTAVACRWLADGTVDELEVAKRADAERRQRLARAALGDLEHVGHPASYVLWLPLPPDARADRVASDLAAQGVAVSTAEPFATTRHVPQALRLALGSVDLDALPHAVDRVARVVRLDAAR